MHASLRCLQTLHFCNSDLGEEGGGHTIANLIQLLASPRPPNLPFPGRFPPVVPPSCGAGAVRVWGRGRGGWSRGGGGGGGAIPAGEGQLRVRGKNDPCSRLAESRLGSPGIAETPAGLEGAGCYVLRAVEVR